MEKSKYSYGIVNYNKIIDAIEVIETCFIFKSMFYFACSNFVKSQIVLQPYRWSGQQIAREFTGSIFFVKNVNQHSLVG